MIQDVSCGFDNSDPWKAKRGREKIESRKRRVERERRKRRFEEMRGKRGGEWMVEEAEKMFGGLAV